MAEKYISYFNEFAQEDCIDDILTVSETASRIIYERFKIKIDDPKQVAVIFSKVYKAILDELVSKEATHDFYELDICGRLVMGYTTSSDEDDEKQGNYAIYINSKELKKKNEDLSEPSSSPIEKCEIWNVSNNITNPDNIRAISMRAIELLKDVDIYLANSEIVMPIFISLYETIIKYVTTKRFELDEFEYGFDFLGCFVVTATESDNEMDNIIITPGIDSKLTLKNDAQATAKFE